ncbi:transposase [Streptomyces litchfieldiae]|uniref:Transposase n=1 Tax=Streptomyces litchfieldiae TaxID=3075543 RepID=A0ABU2MWF2_9ACTN|nr:transposase [Streptomyces sp. DSM 44938]MDT0345934.1 transposase [Streptomyces sp. DSM 44938]
MHVLVIDEARRGRAQWRQDADTGRRESIADRWHTGFVDAAGHQGLLGQVEGRLPSDVLAWLAGIPKPWREQIRYVVIDISPGYRAAIRTGLPQAHVVADYFTSSNSPTGCSTWCAAAPPPPSAGAGRACDPEWKARRRLLRNREDLTDDQFTPMRNQLIDTGSIGMIPLTALDHRGTTA